MVMDGNDDMDLNNPPVSYENGELLLSDQWRPAATNTLNPDDTTHASIHVGRNNTVSDERLEAAARMAEPVSAAGYQVDVSDGCVIIAADGRRGIFNLDTGDMSVYRGGDEDALLEFEARPGENGFAKGDDRHVDAMLDRLAGNRIAPDALRDLVRCGHAVAQSARPNPPVGTWDSHAGIRHQAILVLAHSGLLVRPNRRASRRRVFRRSARRMDICRCRSNRLTENMRKNIRIPSTRRTVPQSRLQAYFLREPYDWPESYILPQAFNTRIPTR